MQKNLYNYFKKLFLTNVLALYRYFIAAISVGVVISPVIASAESEKPEINRILIFGDSLSDTGAMREKMYKAVPSRQAYWEGRFSDGFVWTDYLAQSYNTTITDPNFIINQSLAGTTAFPYSYTQKRNLLSNIFNFSTIMDKFEAAIMTDFMHQITALEKNIIFNDKDLAIVWMGANDMLWVAETFNKELSKKEIADNAATYIGKGLEYLLEKNIKNIIILGMLDLDLVPRFWSAPGYSEQIAYFNTLLETKVNELKSGTKHLYFVNIDAFFKQFLIPKQSDFGFNDDFKKHDGHSYEKKLLDVTLPGRLKYLDFAVYHRGESPHVFWDAVHPSTKTHSLLAELLKQQYIERNFEVKTHSEKCNCVEIENQTLQPLKISYQGNHATCGTRNRSIMNGESTVISIPDGDYVSLSLFPGGSANVLVSNESNIVYKTLPAGYKIQIPIVQKITCKKSGLFALQCH